MNLDQLFSGAVAHHQSGRLQEAEKCYRQILAVDPRHAHAMQLLGTLAHQCGHHEAAIDLIGRSIAIAPSPQAYCNLGEVFRRLGRFEEAERALRLGLSLDATDAGLHINLASVLRERRKFDESLVAVRRAMELSPEHPHALHALMNVLGDLGDVDQAVEVGRRLEKLTPDDADFLHDLGAAHVEAGRFDDAHSAMERAIKASGANVNPTYPYSLSIVQLLLGDFSAGWTNYQHRWQTRHFIADARHYAQSMWDGSEQSDKRLLLWSEQGFGDIVMMARYIPECAKRARTIVECPRELLALLRSVDPAVEWTTRGEQTPVFDLHLPMLDLPRVFGTTVGTIPADVPYLRAEESLRQAWRERLSRESKGLRVGLAWAGRPTHHNDHNRSMTLETLTPLLTTGARFYSLQKGPASEEIAKTQAAGVVTDWSNDLHDFADTAALIGELDLVICVDTSIAHVAGALGKPVWVMLPFSPDWRWLVSRPDDSPWYPTMRLFRQSRPRGWTAVVERVVAEITTIPAMTKRKDG